MNGFVAESPFQEREPQGDARLVEIVISTQYAKFKQCEELKIQVVHHQGLEPGTP